MSLFSWLSPRKKTVAKQDSIPITSGLSRMEPTRPVHGRSAPEREAQAQPANRKGERMARRELLYGVIRECMANAGVLSASYKFKVLSLDSRGRQFLAMIDLSREFGGNTDRLAEIEAMIAQAAKARFDIIVTAVYWRTKEHVAVGLGDPRVAAAAAAAGTPGRAAPSRPMPLHSQPAPLHSQPAALHSQPAALNSQPGILNSAPSSLNSEPGALDPRVAAPLAGSHVAAVHAAAHAARPAAQPAPRAGQIPPPPKSSEDFDPLLADEVAAFKRALAHGVSGAQAIAAHEAVHGNKAPQRNYTLLTGFEDTELPEDARAPALSATQYGDLR